MGSVLTKPGVAETPAVVPQLLKTLDLCLPDPSKLSITVVTYNVLASLFEGYQTYVQPRNLLFTHRKEKIEVDHEEIYEQVLRNLGFKVYSAKRPGYVADGSFLAWKDEVWTPAFLEKIEFDKCPEAAHNFDYRRGNVGAVGLFSHRNGGKVMVATVHLFWNPEYPDVKIAQARMLLRSVESVSALSTLGTIITGDFNSMPESPVYKYMTEHTLGDTRLQSAYSQYEDGHHPAFTNYTKNFKGTLDYIFHSGDLRPVRLLKLPDEEECSREIALPNTLHGSDHLPLLALLEKYR